MRGMDKPVDQKNKIKTDLMRPALRPPLEMRAQGQFWN